MKLIKSIVLSGVILLSGGYLHAESGPRSPAPLLPFPDFSKLPKPGAMFGMPKWNRGKIYKPFVWNTMLETANLVLPEKIRAVDKEPFQWNLETLYIISHGNPITGEKLSRQHKCVKCHGKSGISDENDTPSIAGQSRPYTYKQLFDYRNKARDENIMYKKVRHLSNQDMADLAAWYEVHKIERSIIRNTPKKPPSLVINGDPERLLIPCASCHGRWGEGLGFETPAIAGQKAEHFIDTLNAFKEGDRTNDMYGRMQFITQQLTDDEIEELAHYYASISSMVEEDDE